MKIRRGGRIGLLAVTAILGVTLAACGSSSSGNSSSGSSGSSGSSPSASSSPSTSGTDTSQPFGSACSAVPATGSGSFNGMATAPVATAASANPVLSTLVTAVKAAGLVDTLNSAQGITVFAPDNDAFKSMDQATLKKALADPTGLLTTVLKYHVVAQKITPDQLENGSFKTLEGGTLTTSGSGTSFTVGSNKANIVCGNVQTANATVYIIDKVLAVPAS